jgi:membrane protease YdiL (CAAX protease family)
MMNTPAIALDKAPKQRRAMINYAVFAAVAVTMGWAGIALDTATDQPATNSLGMGLWFVSPLLAAIVLFRFHPDGAGPLGLTLRFRHRARWFGLAVLVYPVVTALIVLARVAFGLDTFDASGPSGSRALIVAMAVVVPALVFKNTIEELTWRGFGTRTALATGMSRLGSHILVGVTWGLWHLPLYVHFMARADFRTLTSLPWPLFIPIFFAGVIASAVILGELRLRTGSIWPGVVMHTVGGAIVNTLIVEGYLSFNGHGDAVFSPAPNSIAFVVLFGLIGVLMLRQVKSGAEARSVAGADPVRATIK